MFFEEGEGGVFVLGTEFSRAGRMVRWEGKSVGNR